MSGRDIRQTLRELLTRLFVSEVFLFFCLFWKRIVRTRVETFTILFVRIKSYRGERVYFDPSGSGFIRYKKEFCPGMKEIFVKYW